MKQKLLEDIKMILVQEGAYTRRIESLITLTLGDYDVSKAERDIVPYSNEHSNAELIKRFIMNKTVKGLTERTLRYYHGELTRIFRRINKPINRVSVEDLKMYLATRQMIDAVSDTSIGNDWRVLSTFYSWMLNEN